MATEGLIIKEFEEILARLTENNQPYWEVNNEDANPTMFKAYCISKEAGQSMLDFNEAIWDEDIKPIADKLRMSGIREFTISVRQGNLTDVLAAFQELGIFVKGIVNVNARYKSCGRCFVSAVLMQVA